MAEADKNGRFKNFQDNICNAQMLGQMRRKSANLAQLNKILEVHKLSALAYDHIMKVLTRVRGLAGSRVKKHCI